MKQLLNKHRLARKAVLADIVKLHGLLNDMFLSKRRKVQLLQHDCHGLSLVICDVLGPSSLGIVAQRLAQSLLLRLSRQRWIQRIDCTFQTFAQDNVGVGLAFRCRFVRSNIWAVLDGPAKLLDLFEGELFDVRFSYASHDTSAVGPCDLTSWFSRSDSHCSGLFTMYSRTRFNSSSPRIMCS